MWLTEVDRRMNQAREHSLGNVITSADLERQVYTPSSPPAAMLARARSATTGEGDPTAISPIPLGSKTAGNGSQHSRNDSDTLALTDDITVPASSAAPVANPSAVQAAQPQGALGAFKGWWSSRNKS